MPWVLNLQSQTEIGSLADEAVLVKIKLFLEDSQHIDGSPRVHRDLREEGIRCCEKQVAAQSSMALCAWLQAAMH